MLSLLPLGRAQLVPNTQSCPKALFAGPQGLFEASSGAPRDNLGDKLADKLRPGGPWIGDNSALQDSGAPGLSEDNLGDKLADKLGDNLGPEARIGDNSALQDSGAPGLSEDNLGDKLADKLRPGARIGDNSALQDSGAPGLSEDNLGDKLADKLRLGGPDWRQFCVTGFRGPGIVRGQSGRQTGGQTGRQSRPGGPDWRQFCVTGFRGPGLSEDNLGDKSDKLRLGGWIGDNSALQDSGAPGLSEDNLGDKLADKLRPGGPDWRQFCVTGFRGPGIVRGQSGRQTGGQTEAWRPGLETILRYRIPGPRDCPRTIWATNRTN